MMAVVRACSALVRAECIDQGEARYRVRTTAKLLRVVHRARWSEAGAAVPGAYPVPDPAWGNNVHVIPCNCIGHLVTRYWHILQR